MPATALLLFWLAAQTPQEYAGAAACATCHPTQAKSQGSTAHAKAIARSKPSQPGEWAFGAGEKAITFVRRLDSEHYLEEGKSWYRALGGYGRTPGHPNDDGVRDRIFDPAAAMLRCFACHSTGPLSVSREGVIQPNELGVRCEACHGPAAAHALDPAKVRPRNPGKLSADELNRLCGECHRMPLQSANLAGLRDPWTTRHQPIGLAASDCFLKSNGRLSCLTCHLPHEPVTREAASYSVVCGKCHASPRHSTAIARRACVECHMPRVRAQPYLVFSNHRIAVYAPGDPLIPVNAR